MERLLMERWWRRATRFGGAPKSVTPRRFRLLRVAIDNLTMADTLEAIDQAVRGGPSSRLRVAFANADCLNKATSDPGYRAALADMSLVLPDGVGVRLGARMGHVTVQDNVNGTDLFPLLCERLARRGGRLFLYGAKPGVAGEAAAWASRHYPGLVICGVLDGFATEGSEAARLIREARPDVLLVAMGAPRQEQWIARYGEQAEVAVAMGVGGLFDFYSGRIPRAPRWMRRASLEWVYRLWQEPRRMWRRYLVGNAVFLVRVWRAPGSPIPAPVMEARI